MNSYGVGWWMLMGLFVYSGSLVCMEESLPPSTYLQIMRQQLENRQKNQRLSNAEVVEYIKDMRSVWGKNTRNYKDLTALITEYSQKDPNWQPELGSETLSTSSLFRQEERARQSNEDKKIKLVVIDDRQSVELPFDVAKQSDWIMSELESHGAFGDTVSTEHSLFVPEISYPILQFIAELLTISAGSAGEMAQAKIIAFLLPQVYSFEELYAMIKAIYDFEIINVDISAIALEEVSLTFVNKTLSVVYAVQEKTEPIAPVSQILKQVFLAKIKDEKLSFDNLFVCIQNLNNQLFTFLAPEDKPEVLNAACKAFADKITTTAEAQEVLGKGYVWGLLGNNAFKITRAIAERFKSEFNANEAQEKAFNTWTGSPMAVFYLVAAKEHNWDTKYIDELPEFKNVREGVKQLVATKSQQLNLDQSTISVAGQPELQPAAQPQQPPQSDLRALFSQGVQSAKQKVLSLYAHLYQNSIKYGIAAALAGAAWLGKEWFGDWLYQKYYAQPSLSLNPKE